MDDIGRLHTERHADLDASSPDPSALPARSARHIAVILREFSSGGSERVAIRLANQWARSGRRVTIIVGRDEGPVRNLVEPAVGVRILGQDARAVASAGTFAQGVAGAVRLIGPDMIMGPGNSYVSALSRVMSLLRRDCPAIVCKISNPLVRPSRSRIGQLLFERRFRYLTQRFDGLAAMSPALRTEAQDLVGRRDVASLPEPNLDTATLPVRTDRPQFHILCVGRLTAQKNFALALQTLALLNEPYHMTILGEGEQKSALAALADRLGIAERVRFAGFVDDVAAHLKTASILLSTSHFEGFPAVLVEAAAAGVPIVSTPCSITLPDILLDPTFGLVVPAEDVLLARAIHVVGARQRAPNSSLLAKFIDQHQLDRSAGLWLDWMDSVLVKRART